MEIFKNKIGSADQGMDTISSRFCVKMKENSDFLIKFIKIFSGPTLLGLNIY